MRKPDYRRIAAPNSFIADYMAMFVNVETAHAYDFWCACWLVSNALGRGVIVPRPHAPVFLNLYAILCADAGITRKSTAVRHARLVLQRYIEQTGRRIPLLTGSVSPEMLDDTLATNTTDGFDSHVAICVSELVSFLGRERYSAGMPGKLTDLYDCPEIHARETLSRGKLLARNVYPTFLAASTPSWLVRAVNPDVVEGGFTSRCLFVIEEEPKKLVAWPEDEDGARSDARMGAIGARLARLHADASYANRQNGGITPTSAARSAFREWYENRTSSADPFAASFAAREDHHILRLAAILAASDGTWEIAVNHIEQSIKVVEWIRGCGMALFGSGIQATRYYALVDRLRTALIQAGRAGMSQSALTAICRKHGTNDDMRAALTIMHELQLLQKFEVQTGGKGRPTTMWRATKNIVVPTSVEDVVEVLHPSSSG